MSPFFDGSKHKKDAATAMKVFGQLAIFNKDLKSCEELKEKELIEAKELFSDLVNEVIGAKYLVSFSSHFLKTREKYVSFGQFVCFLRKVRLLFIFFFNF